MVGVNKLPGSDYGQAKFRVMVRVILGLELEFDPNNVIALTLTPRLILTLNPNPRNYIKT